MARVRNLKPGFFSNEDLAECTPWARLCFAGLWTIADREGRLEDRPKRIKGQLFPMDSIEVEPLLVELVQHGFLIRYTVNGHGFIQVIEFSKHQNPHHREPSSVIPPPKSPGLLVHRNGAEPEALCPSYDSEAQGKPEAFPSIHDIPCTSGRAEPGTRNPEQGKRTLAQQAERLFEDRFWPSYPRKVGREAALKSFVKLKPDDGLLETILTAVKRQAASDQWQRDKQFIPHPATWLNGKRWQDEADASGNFPQTPDYLVGAI